jgi:hypothetical protein
MKKSLLDEHIENVVGRNIPPCPPTIPSQVLRKIHLTDSQSENAPLSFAFFPPLYIAASVALLISVGTALRFSPQSSAPPPQRELALIALDFDVFKSTTFHAHTKRSK